MGSIGQPESIKTADLVRAAGMLIQCDASIKAIIQKIDEKYGGFIQEDVDEETLTINANKLTELKNRLKEVLHPPLADTFYSLTVLQELKDTVREAEESGSD